MTSAKTATLNEKERIALHGVSEALVLIRNLAAAPFSTESLKIIHDLADAFHNVPAHCAGPEQQRDANAFLIEAAMRNAAKTCLDHGFNFTPAIREHWTSNVETLEAELAAAGVDPHASYGAIAATAGSWFATMSANEKASLIATMHSRLST